MEVDENFLSQVETEVTKVQAENERLKGQAAGNFQPKDGNLIEFQVETAEMLSRIEHFLRGEYVAYNQENDEYWAKQDNSDLVLFNDYGVNVIMSTIGQYIDKNTILSFYNEMRINEILADLGDELIDFIYCNYEKMGMNTEFKKTRYPLTVITIIHSIESTYRKAIGGKASENINTSKIFTQSDIFGRPQQQAPQKAKFNLFSPKTW